LLHSLFLFIFTISGIIVSESSGMGVIPYRRYTPRAFTGRNWFNSSGDSYSLDRRRYSTFFHVPP